MKKKKSRLSLDTYYQGIINGDRLILSRAITLAESELEEDNMLSKVLINKCRAHTGNSIRIGITGIPGVGKSTFIDSFGEFLIERGKKVAVLAIDPSSTRTRGSILGDKTRMDTLSQNLQAFIRPSPSSGSLGGVAQKTRETLLLCEAAGFNVILIETVGVGQSELSVKGMVDLFLLLMLPNAGDELQGIKRGIMEMADAIFINKCDGEFIHLAQRAANRYKQATKLQNPHSTWKVPVLTGSGLFKTGFETLWKSLQDFQTIQFNNNQWLENRKQQSLNWLQESIETYLLQSFRSDLEVQSKLDSAQKEMIQSDYYPNNIEEELSYIWASNHLKKKGSK